MGKAANIKSIKRFLRLSAAKAFLRSEIKNV